MVAAGQPTATLARPVASAGSRGLFGRRAPTREPALAACAPCGGPAVTMMRPVAGQPSGADASAWVPVQRVEPAGPGVTMERAVPVAYAPVVSTEPPPMAPPVLPMPRAVANGHPPTGVPAVSLPPIGVPHAPDVPREFFKRALSDYIVEPPDFLQIVVRSGVIEPISPEDEKRGLGRDTRYTVLVQPDGQIRVGSLDPIFVAGRRLEEVRDLLAEAFKRLRGNGPSLDSLKKRIQVEVSEFNSKFYYVITDGGGYGAQVFRLPYTGNETVLDAFALVQGLPAVASKKKIWVARATPDGGHHPHILPVDWVGIVQRGSAATNYQLYPGDRIFVHSDALIRADSFLGKLLSPIERVLGTTLLGSSVVNSISGRGQGFN